MNYNKENIKELIKIWEDNGYKKFRGHYKKEDYGYWKSAYEEKRDKYGDKVLKYQVIFLIYDFSKYDNYPDKVDCIGISRECLISDDFGGTSVVKGSRKVNIKEFEKYCENFFNFETKNNA